MCPGLACRPGHILFLILQASGTAAATGTAAACMDSATGTAA